MKQERLLEQIKRRARLDRARRRDPRYLDTMGFLIAKGFLKINQPLLPMPNKRLRIADAIWAGQNVEPRILEVLPAAVLRLPNHFDLDPERHVALIQVLGQLRRGDPDGDGFQGHPYAKLRQWVDFPLRDRRMRPVSEKKVTKTFRLGPAAIARLREIATERNCPETEVIEGLLLDTL